MVDSEAIRIIAEGAMALAVGIYLNKMNRDNERREKEREQRERERIEQEQERYAREEERIARLALLEEALTAILRDRIIQSCRFFINKGSISPFERENIERMYHAYHDGLGGNDIASDVYNLMKDLPLEV